VEDNGIVHRVDIKAAKGEEHMAKQLKMAITYAVGMK